MATKTHFEVAKAVLQSKSDYREIIKLTGQQSSPHGPDQDTMWDVKSYEHNISSRFCVCKEEQCPCTD